MLSGCYQISIFSILIYSIDSSFVCCPERTANGIDIDTLRKGFGNSEDNLSKLTSLSENTQRGINQRLAL